MASHLSGRLTRRLFVPVLALAVAASTYGVTQTAGAATAPAAPVWSQLGGGPRHSGYNPAETVLTPATVPALTQRWAVPTGGAVGWPPAVVGGVVYASSFGHKVYAVRADTGKVLWTRAVGTGYPIAPAVGQGRVYVVASRTLRALDATTGAVKWTRTFSYDVTAPTFTDGTVYLAGAGKILAFNATTGARRWTSQNLGDAIESTPAVQDGIVYAGLRSGRLYALKTTDGSQLWSYFAGLDRAIYVNPVLANSSVYAVTEGGNVVALNPTTGVLLWSRDGLASGPVAAGGGVIYTAGQGSASALDARTGATLWTASLPGNAMGAPVIAGSVLYVSTYPGGVAALNAKTGSPLWSRTLGQFTTASPVVAGGRLFVGSDNGTLYAFAP
jgi:outer membrane protein assembly factor BamB